MESENFPNHPTYIKIIRSAPHLKCWLYFSVLPVGFSGNVGFFLSQEPLRVGASLGGSGGMLPQN